MFEYNVHVRDDRKIHASQLLVSWETKWVPPPLPPFRFGFQWVIARLEGTYGHLMVDSDRARTGESHRAVGRVWPPARASQQLVAAEFPVRAYDHH